MGDQRTRGGIDRRERRRANDTRDEEVRMNEDGELSPELVHTSDRPPSRPSMTEVHFQLMRLIRRSHRDDCRHRCRAKR